MTQGTPLGFLNVRSSQARILTPLGYMEFSIDVNGERLEPSQNLYREVDIELRHSVNTAVTVAHLLLPFSPKLPEGMRVDRCGLSVW